MENQTSTADSLSRIISQEPRALTSFSHLIPQTVTENLECANHGSYPAEVLVFHDGKRKASPCPACKQREEVRKDAEAAKEAQRRAEVQAELVRKRIEANLGRSGIPPRFSGKGFETFAATCEDTAKKLRYCREYAENFPENLRNGVSIVMSGNTGTGKTHLACAIANHVIQCHSATALYLTVMRAVRMVKETYAKGSEKSERQALEELASQSLLILDEAGVQFGTDAEKNILFEIVNERYERMNPTILISNLNMEGLRQYVGDRVLDRMRENGGKTLLFNIASKRGEV